MEWKTLENSLLCAHGSSLLWRCQKCHPFVIPMKLSCHLVRGTLLAYWYEGAAHASNTYGEAPSLCAGELCSQEIEKDEAP